MLTAHELHTEGQNTSKCPEYLFKRGLCRLGVTEVQTAEGRACVCVSVCV